MVAFVTVTRRHIDRRLSRQISADNVVVAETIATMIGRIVGTADRATLVAALQDVCMTVALPNSGYVCVVDGQGRLVAGPTTDGELPGTLDGMRIIPEGSEEARDLSELPRDRSVRGRAIYGNDPRIDIVAATPIPGTDLTVLIHQDLDSVRQRSMESAMTLAVPGAIITILLSIVAFLVVDGIVGGYKLRIEAANADLRESNRKRSQLIHILCHDLKNPVGAIRTGIGLLRGGDRENDFAVDLIDTSARSALDVIENVRESEALTSGKRRIRLESVDLKRCAETSVAMLRRTFLEKGITAEVSVPKGCSALAEETSLCNSVLNNLLSNAAKFSERGSRVVIDAAREAEWITLSVRDYGIGIPEDILRRVFEPTEQTSRPGTEGESGTGFGMPLVKQFVEGYGGEVQIRSIVQENGGEDHGTEVSIRLKPGAEYAEPAGGATSQSAI